MTESTSRLPSGGCALQFLPMAYFVVALVFHDRSDVVKIAFNLGAAFMVLAAIVAGSWLWFTRRTSNRYRWTMWLGLIVNGIFPALGYVAMLALWRVP